MGKINLRSDMEKAATYLASGEEGKGLDPVRVEQSIMSVKKWKHFFVEFMIGKTNYRDGGEFTKESAGLLADNIFRAFYDNEVRAFSEEPLGRWGQHRKLSELEYGLSPEYSTQEMERPDWTGFLIKKARWNTPVSRKQKNYGQLLSWAINKPVKRNQILRNARLLMSRGAITKDQFIKLNNNIAQLRKDNINNTFVNY